MQGNEICRGARHRILILTYISWLTLSLAPTIVAPPERGFVQGQPEMQQAMDNMVAHGTVVKKRMNASPNDDVDYHAVLTSKTSNLLTEAEHVLSSLPVSKERQWIDAFVRRMRAISTMLQKTAQNKNQNSPKILNSMSGTPVPEGLPLQPTWPATSAVPGINPFQKQNRMMSKFPVTSPELSQVLPANEYPSERQAVTKPAVLSNKKEETEDDELVKELESLHQEFVQPVFQQNSKVLDQVPIFTTPSTVSLESQSNKLTVLEEEKASLKAKLIQEIAEFQRLGGVIPNEVIHALYTNSQKATGLAHNQKSDIEDKLKFTEAGMVDEPEIQRLNDFNIEDREISNTNLLNMEKNMAYQAGKHIQPLNFSHSFQNINPHFHPNLHVLSKVMGNRFQYMSPQSKEPPYKGHENAIHGLHQPHPYNKQEQYHAIVPSTNQQSGHIPDALKQMLSKPQNKMYHEHLPASNYNEYLMKHSYGPYPYMYNWDKKNLTHHLSMAMPPYQTKQPVSHQIDTQLSDEMKRQLRDGKIIVLSDSVVRSNFEPNNDEKSTENKPDKPENAENNNNTTTSN